jgi:Uma2 family endonuclease
MSTTFQTTAPVAPVLPHEWTVADLQAHVGGVPLERIRLFPSPGSATEEDLLSAAREGHLCELVDGVLVEKTMATYESLLAFVLGHLLQIYLDKNPLGVLIGGDGPLRILPTKIRLPDVSFVAWERFPGGQLPHQRVYTVAPDLAVEIISEGNTEAEMQLKLADYFESGTRLVWYIDPHTHSARIFTARDQVRTIDENGLLDGSDVLPGFQLRLKDLFDRAARSGQSK